MSEQSRRLKTATYRRLALGFAIAGAVIALDQWVKWWVVTVVMQPPQVIELTGFLNLVITWNHGFSFGLFAGEARTMPIILIGVAAVVVVMLVLWLIRADRMVAALWLGLVIGGAVGNVVDRVRIGAVADFIDVHLGDWHWPAFNVADSAITIGVMLIVIDGLFSRRDLS